MSYIKAQELVIAALLDIGKPGVNPSTVMPSLHRLCSGYMTAETVLHNSDQGDRREAQRLIQANLIKAGYQEVYDSGTDVALLGIFQSERTEDFGSYVESNVSFVTLISIMDRRMNSDSHQTSFTERLYTFNFPLRLGNPVPSFINPAKSYQNQLLKDSEVFQKSVSGLRFVHGLVPGIQNSSTEGD